METFSMLLTFARGVHRSPVDSPHKCQWHRALMSTLLCAWSNGWANNQDTSDLNIHHAHYVSTGMIFLHIPLKQWPYISWKSIIDEIIASETWFPNWSNLSTKIVNLDIMSFRNVRIVQIKWLKISWLMWHFLFKLLDDHSYFMNKCSIFSTSDFTWQW